MGGGRGCVIVCGSVCSAVSISQNEMCFTLTSYKDDDANFDAGYYNTHTYAIKTCS